MTGILFVSAMVGSVLLGKRDKSEVVKSEEIL
jgi:hypothetical protein